MKTQDPDSPRTANALATVTRLDRRTVAHHLNGIAPDEMVGTSRRWRLSTLADAMRRNGSHAALPSPFNPIRWLALTASTDARHDTLSCLGAVWLTLTRELGIADEAAKKLYVQAVVASIGMEQDYVTQDRFAQKLFVGGQSVTIDALAEKMFRRPFNSKPPTMHTVKVPLLAREWCKEVCDGELAEELTTE